MHAGEMPRRTPDGEAEQGQLANWARLMMQRLLSARGGGSKPNDRQLAIQERQLFEQGCAAAIRGESRIRLRSKAHVEARATLGRPAVGEDTRTLLAAKIPVSLGQPTRLSQRPQR